MIAFTLKPVGGKALYVIYAIVSYEQNRGEGGVLAFEEICSGYHVFADRQSLLFTQSLDEASAFIDQQLAAIATRMLEARELEEQALLARPARRLAERPEAS